MPASNHRTPRMEDVQRRRFRDFVALAIPAVWLSASPFLLIAFGADLPIAVGAAVFAATFVHAAYLARPRPMDRRVLRPIMIGSLLLAAATIAPRLIAFVTNDTYLDVGVSVSILIVTVLVVRSQVLKVIGSPPRPPHVGEWPIVSGGPQRHERIGRIRGDRLRAHCLWGFLGGARTKTFDRRVGDSRSRSSSAGHAGRHISLRTVFDRNQRTC